MAADYEIFDLGDHPLYCGQTLRNAKLAYKTYGKLNKDKSNAIIYPTWYSGFISQNEWLIGPGKGLDPAKYFIIVPALFGNGQSSSPSNTPIPHNAARFPDIMFQDNVAAQYRLVTEKFKIPHLRMALGWSMGAVQAYQWAVQYPDFVDAIVPFCGSSKCSPHNFIFLEAVRGAIMTDAAWNGGWYKEQPWKGLRAVGRVYAGWGFSRTFYWNEEWRGLGFTSLEDFLVSFWEGYFAGGERDANNLLTLAWTWQHGDVGQTKGFNGDTVKALKSIKARVIQMPGDSDMYFHWKDEEAITKHLKHGELRPIPSTWGHFAGFGTNDVDTAFIDKAVKELLKK